MIKEVAGTLLPLMSLSLILGSGVIQASDHIDSPAAVNDPVADILDFYAFMEPFCQTSGGVGCEAEPEELILAMTVNPSATAETQFSDAVEYHFYFENDVGVTGQIDCSFSSSQTVSCSGLNGLSVQAPVGQIGVNGDIRVFAGLRDDPSFLDAVALAQFQAIGIAAFSPPGEDSLAGTNVLAIVVGIKNNAFPAGSGAVDTNGDAINVQKIWVASERTGSEINAGTSGSWFNPEQDGQGWVIEVISSTSGENQFLFYFYGYDNDGERLWLIGITDHIEGSSVTVEALLFSGTGFGGDLDPDSVTDEAVGSVTFDFHDCDNGTATFSSTHNDLNSFTTSMQRLSNIASLPCTSSGNVQIDRKGRPLVSALIPEEMRDAYNAASDPGTWASQFNTVIEAGLTTVDMADLVVGNAFVPPPVMAPIVVDDRLQVDLEWSQCSGLYTIEASDLVPQPHTNNCGGRKLSEDVVDDSLSMMVSGWDPVVSDFVDANDVEFLSEFPFLAPPH
jgi:hypothetical protein